MTSHVTEEEETGRAIEHLTDWRRVLSIFYKLGKEERETLISLISAWAELDTEGRILLRVIAKALAARHVQKDYP